MNKDEKKNPDKSKIEALKKHGTLNTKVDLVTDFLFREHDFFDPYDLMQVKYEMLRHVYKEGESITQASSAFGFSRLSFYRIQAAFKKYGLAGLLLKKRGPRSAHKLSPEIMEFVEETKKKDKSLRSSDMKKLIEERFDIQVHTRSIERALTRRKKN
jgi:transposase